MTSSQVKEGATTVRSEGSVTFNPVEAIKKQDEVTTNNSELAEYVTTEIAETKANKSHIATIGVTFSQFSAQDDNLFAKYSGLLELLSLKKDHQSKTVRLLEMKESIAILETEVAAAGQLALELDVASYNSQQELEMKEAARVAFQERHSELQEKAKELDSIENQINASKMAIEASKLQVVIDQLRHSMLEVKLRVPELRKQESTLRERLNAERLAVSESEKELRRIEQDIAEKSQEFIKASSEAEEQIGQLEARITILEDVIAQQLQEIQALIDDKNNPLSAASTSVLGDGSQDGNDSVTDPEITIQQLTLTNANLATKVDELSAENVKLMAVFKAFQDVRDRKYEWDVNGRAKDEHIIKKGERAIKYGDCYIDAILFTSPKNTRDPNEFLISYFNIDPKIVLEHHEFTMFHDILNFRCDLRKAGILNSNQTFQTAFATILNAIYPNFEIGCNVQIKSRPELMTAYELMKTEHQALLDRTYTRPSFSRERNPRAPRAASAGFSLRGGRGGGSGSFSHHNAAENTAGWANTSSRFTPTGDIRLTDGSATWDFPSSNPQDGAQ